MNDPSAAAEDQRRKRWSGGALVCLVIGIALGVPGVLAVAFSVLNPGIGSAGVIFAGLARMAGIGALLLSSAFLGFAFFFRPD